MGFVKLWEDPAMSCFRDITVILTNTVDGFVNRHFGRFRQLEKYIRYYAPASLGSAYSELGSRSLIEPEMDQYIQKASQALQKTLQLEHFPLYTQNAHYFRSKKKWWITKYETFTRGHGLQASDGVRGYTPTVYEYKKELEVMAEVQAYFQVSYKVRTIV